MQVVSRRRSEVRVPWLHSLAAAQDEEHDDRTDTEGEETEEEQESDTEENQLNEVRGRAEAEWGHGRSKDPRPAERREAEARGETGVCAPRPRDIARACAVHRTPGQPAKRFHALLPADPQPQKAGRAETVIPMMPTKKQAQRGQVTCPRPHSREETGRQFRPFGVHVLSLQLWGPRVGDGPGDAPQQVLT